MFILDLWLKHCDRKTIAEVEHMAIFIHMHTIQINRNADMLINIDIRLKFDGVEQKASSIGQQQLYMIRVETLG